ncbi:MAG: HIT family protein [Luteibaculaceae bacterium]
MATIFSKIISGEIPCYKIAEDDEFLAFLDINPLAEGHTLVIPKQEVDYFFDMDIQAAQRLLAFAFIVEKKIKKAIPCIKVGMSVVGLEVPHAHVHLVPLNRMSDINFSGSKLNPGPDSLKKTQEKILSA